MQPPSRADILLADVVLDMTTCRDELIKPGVYAPSSRCISVPPLAQRLELCVTERFSSALCYIKLQQRRFRWAGDNWKKHYRTSITKGQGILEKLRARVLETTLLFIAGLRRDTEWLFDAWLREISTAVHVDMGREEEDAQIITVTTYPSKRILPHAYKVSDIVDELRKYMGLWDITHGCSAPATRAAFQRVIISLSELMI
jgi:hypothetical protein